MTVQKSGPVAAAAVIIQVVSTLNPNHALKIRMPLATYWIAVVARHVLIEVRTYGAGERGGERVVCAQLRVSAAHY